MRFILILCLVSLTGCSATCPNLRITKYDIKMKHEVNEMRYPLISCSALPKIL